MLTDHMASWGPSGWIKQLRDSFQEIKQQNTTTRPYREEGNKKTPTEIFLYFMLMIIKMALPTSCVVWWLLA